MGHEVVAVLIIVMRWLYFLRGFIILIFELDILFEWDNYFLMVGE